jgi:DNA invertase Pin-like site-specific DNA recombinase
MTVAVYARVSTEGQNLAGQKREIMKWLEGNGINSKHVQWYVDKESGETLNRPEFEQLQKDIFNGAIKTVVVYKLDRLSRSLRDGIDVLCDWCKKHIRVVSTSQQIDFTGAIGQMIAAVLFAVAQMETETRRERQAAGIAAAKEKGVYTGRKLGAVKAGVDPDRAMKLREKGLTNKEIAQALGVSVSSVIRYTKRADQLTTCQ